jgi:hypothetical protein
MRLMRHGPYLVEINLVSNLLLSTSATTTSTRSRSTCARASPLPCPRTIAACGTNLTDEFFVAVKEFNLSWDELVTLSRNSLRFAFAPDVVKADCCHAWPSVLTTSPPGRHATGRGARRHGAQLWLHLPALRSL